LRAGRNPPSVFTIFSFAAYLNKVQILFVLFGFAPHGSDFSFLHPEISGFAIIVLQVGLVSIPLPIISDYLSLDHVSAWREEFPLLSQRFVHQPAKLYGFNLI